MTQYKFIDLFAGLGGFHLALQSLGHKCVFACEIDEELRRIYEKNFEINPFADIRSLDVASVPEHDILCAGFPCQPFSKAGDQQGFECPQWGNLFDYVIRLLSYHKPRCFILENVPNLIRHNQGKTWRSIENRLRRAGFSVQYKILSPHQFGIPQIRKRVFVVGRRGGLNGLVWPASPLSQNLSIHSVLDEHITDAKILSESSIDYLNAWQNFIDQFPKNEDLPSFPIWAMEFGATYPFSTVSPAGAGFKKIRSFKGSFGQPLKNLTDQEVVLALPSYARNPAKKFPNWKIKLIHQNRELYKRHHQWIDQWLPSILEFPQSFQKFEWHCKSEERNIWSYVIQFRASGIRVKLPTFAPSLVSISSQVPVIAWEKRFMSIRECSRLQGMGTLRHLPSSDGAAFRALGNAVNVDVTTKVANRLLDFERDSLDHSLLSLSKHIQHPVAQSRNPTLTAA